MAPASAPTTATELIDVIERQVANGVLAPGDRLPSVRAQATALGVAPNTVAAAYRRLRDRGVVIGRGRQGTVVAERPLITPVLTQEVPAGVVDAMTGNPDPALLPDISDALAAAAAQPMGRYGDALVDPGLAELGRAMFEADGVDAAHITVVSGAMDAVERLLAAHLRSGDRVGVEDPGYASVHQVVTGMGFDLVPVASDDRGMVPAALAKAVEVGLQAVIVTPRANNPSGAAFDRDRVAALDRILETTPDTLVIQDDHAGPIAGVDFVGLGCHRRRWAVVRSMAKSMGPDLRVALVVGDRESVDRVEARLQIGPGWVSHLLQRTVAGLLRSAAANAAITAARATYLRRRERLRDHLTAAGIRASGRSGLHVWVPVPDEQSVVMALLDRGFAVRGGDRFRLVSPPAVRITTASLTDDRIDALAGALVAILEPGVPRSRTA